MAKKSLYEAKIEERQKKNKNIITDMDYYFRDKEEEAKNGYQNTIDMTPPEVVKEVVDILGMWSFIEYAYSRLTEAEKKQLEIDAAPFGKEPKFRGFDGNHEGEYMGTAMFLVNDLERFQEFKGRDFNSHMQLVELYNRMLEAFEPIRKTLTNKPMNLEDLTKILKAQIHPSMREE